VNYQSATDKAAAIRAALKAKGFTGRDVSVRGEYFSLGSAVRIRIKNAAVPVHLCQRLADEVEVIHRCPITFEILGGGNCYATVTLEAEAEAGKAARDLAAVTGAAKVLEGSPEGTLQPIYAGGPYLGRGRNGHGFSVWSDERHLCETQGLHDAALAVALYLEEHGSPGRP